jgi:hypothetical protein
MVPCVLKCSLQNTRNHAENQSVILSRCLLSSKTFRRLLLATPPILDTSCIARISHLDACPAHAHFLKVQPGTIHVLLLGLVLSSTSAYCLVQTLLENPTHLYNERLKVKTDGSTRLTITGLCGELEHLKIDTRLIGESFECVMGECVI